MIILDNKGVEREVQYARKTYGFEEDVINHKQIKKPFVEVLIIGEKNNWKMYYPYDKFKKMNSKTKIK